MASRRAMLLIGLLSTFLPPNTTDAFKKEAAVAYAKGQYAKVLEILPTNSDLTPEAKLLRARTLLKFNQFEEARQTLKTLIHELPHMRDLIRLLQGEALMGQAQYSEAAALFRAAARAKHSRWVDRAWHRRGDALAAAKKYREAINEYRHALRIYRGHPLRPQIELSIAQCLEKSGQAHAAAAAYQEIWLVWPTSSVAKSARLSLDHLLLEGVRIKEPPFWRLIQRISTQRWRKQYKAATAELERMRADPRYQKRSAATEASRLDMELVRTLLKNPQKEDEKKRMLRAMAILDKRYGSKNPSSTVLYYRTFALSRLGRINEAVRLILATVRPPNKAHMQVARFLSQHGQYKKAYQHRLRSIARMHPRLRARMQLRWPWAAYRAEKYDLAIKGFRRALIRTTGLKAYYLYWIGRALEKAGKMEQAITYYHQLIEKHLRTYYGLQARSRLVNAGKLTLAPMFCSSASLPTTYGPTGDPAIPSLLSKMITRYGNLYPSLRRVQTFWRLGMMWDARRELRLIAFDFVWVRSWGRTRWFIHRPESRRMWNGGPLSPQRMGKREREIFQQRVVLSRLLGKLMSQAGIFYFGWLLSPRHPDPIRQAYPQGFHDIVLRVANNYKLDPNMIWAIMRTESAFRSDAISRAGARGLMQVMPTTGRLLAQHMKLENFKLDQLFDPEISLEMAGWYLRSVSDKFKDQLILVAAAYNGGPHNIARWLDQRGNNCDLDEFIEEIPFSESRRYGKKILRLTALYERVYCGKDDRVTTNRLDASSKPFPWF